MPIGIERRAAAIAMLDVATHLDELRAVLVMLDSADGDDVDRGRQEVRRVEAAERGVQVAVARETDDRQLVLRGDGGRIAKLDARRIGERDVQKGDVILCEGADIGRRRLQVRRREQRGKLTLGTAASRQFATIAGGLKGVICRLWRRWDELRRNAERWDDSISDIRWSDDKVEAQACRVVIQCDRDVHRRAAI